MSLILNNSQSNDSLTLYLTDASTWNDTDLPVFTTITDVTLTITYQTPESTLPLTIYTYTNAMTVFQAAIDANDLSLIIYPITGTDLGLGGNTIPLPDGIYTINYTVTDGIDTWTFDNPLGLLLDNLIKNEVYRRVGTIQYQYFANNNYYTKPIDDNLLLQSLYDSMLASAYVAKQEEILKVLETLQRLTD